MKKLFIFFCLLFFANIKFFAQCSAGKYIKDSTCVSCDSGYYCPGDSARHACVLGNGCTNCDKITGYCITCPAGSEADSLGCRACAPGTYKSGSVGNCIPCPPGHFSFTIGSTKCSACSPGTYQNSMGMSMCFKCPKGTFQSDSSATGCINCPSGYTSPLASDSISDCYLVTSEVNSITGEKIVFLYNRCNKIMDIRNNTTYKTMDISIYSLSGHTIMVSILHEKDNFIDLSSLENGVYIFEIKGYNTRYVSKIPIYKE